MKIESLIRRAKGTLVELDDKTYHFKPTESDERHLAEVGIESHAKRLLSITEGYALADGGESPFPVPQQQGNIAGSQVHAAQYTLLNGEILSLDELTSRAFKESGLSIGEWNDLSDEDRYAQIDTTLGEIMDESEPREKHYDAPEVGDDADNEQEEQEEPGEVKTITVQPQQEAPETGDETPPAVTEKPATEPKPAADKSVAEEPVELDREALAKLFEAKFNRKPNGKLSARSIQKALEED